MVYIINVTDTCEKIARKKQLVWVTVVYGNQCPIIARPILCIFWCVRRVVMEINVAPPSTRSQDRLQLGTLSFLFFFFLGGLDARDI